MVGDSYQAEAWGPKPEIGYLAGGAGTEWLSVQKGVTPARLCIERIENGQVQVPVCWQLLGADAGFTQPLESEGRVWLADPPCSLSIPSSAVEAS